MRKRLKDRWVKALRSGKYKQGRDQLVRKGENGEEFCCLGVLCEIQPKRFERMKDGESYYCNKLSTVNWSTLGTSTCRFLGLPVKTADTLIEMNDADNKYWTFPRIANWIERNL